MTKTNKRGKRLLIVSGAILLTIILAFSIYVSNYYHADTEAIESYLLTESIEKANVTKTKLTDKATAYEPESTTTGFIFYPGGKVEHTAYEPLMVSLAEKGITSILMEMPFNLAVFDINAADGIIAKYPEIDTWYIGGHSLGGSMAASYLAKHTDDFAGLILLASYSTVDFSNSDLEIISIYGSEDKVLNAENYAKNKLHLPKDFTEFIIEGGCHAYFGMYGMQNGDGTPSIDNRTQIEMTSEAISKFVSD